MIHKAQSQVGIHEAQAQVGTHNLRVKYGRQLNQILILRSHQTVVKNIVT